MSLSFIFVQDVVKLPSAYWYYGLILISVILTGISLYYKKCWRLLVLHIIISGIIHPVELIILLTGGYYYLPGILHDPQIDSGLGAYVSDFFIVPASAVAINAFSLSWHSTLGIAIVFTVIDWLFAKIGIYVHFWWKSIYTGIGLIILYSISKWFWRSFQEKQPSLIFRLLVIYLTYAPIHSIINFVVARLLHAFTFEVTFFTAPERNFPVFNNLHLLLTTIVVTLCIGLRVLFRYRIIGIIPLGAVNWALGYFHIFESALLSSQYLTLIPIIGILFIMTMYRIAKLNYLFP